LKKTCKNGRIYTIIEVGDIFKMKNKDTKWLKDALKWSAEKGYKLEEAVEGYWNQVQALGTMIKGSKIVAGISGAVGLHLVACIRMGRAKGEHNRI